jgi:hypothetical protein
MRIPMKMNAYSEGNANSAIVQINRPGAPCVDLSAERRIRCSLVERGQSLEEALLKIALGPMFKRWQVEAFTNG